MSTTADSVIVELEAKNAQYDASIKTSARAFDASMSRMEASAKRMERKTSGAFNMVKGVMATAGAGLIAGISIGAITAFANEALQYASSLGEVAQQLGVTTKQLQTFRYAATQVGVSQEEMDQGLSKLTKSLGDAALGAKQDAKVFAALGISLKNADGSIRTAGDALPLLADALAQIEDPAKRAALEVQIFGRAGQKLDTLLAGGSGAIAELSTEAERLGIILSDQQIQRADDTADKIAKLQFQLKQNIAGAVAENADAILALANAFASLVLGIGKAISAYSRWTTMGKIDNPFASAKDKQEARSTLLGTREGRVDLFERSKDPSRYADSPEGRKQAAADRAAAVAAEVAARRRGTSAASGSRPTVNNGLIDNILAPDGKKGAGASGPSIAEVQARFAMELSRYFDQQLSAEADLTADVIEKAALAREQLTNRRDAINADIDADKNYNAAQKAALKAANNRASALEADAINLRENQQVQEDALAALKAAIGTEEELLSIRAGMARTAAERRDIELNLLALARKQEEAELARIIADDGRNQTYSPAEVARAKARKEALPGIYDEKTSATSQQNQGPLGTYLDGIPRTIEEINEQLEQTAANGLKSLEDGFVGAAEKALHLHGVLGQVISDLIRMVAQQAILAAFGGGGGGIGGAIGGLFGFAQGGGGIIGGRPGTDRNVLSLNGKPFAKVSQGESLSISPTGRAASPGGGGTVVQQFFTLDARGGITTPELLQHVNAIASQKAAQAGQAAFQASQAAVPGRISRQQTLGT